MGFPGLKGLFEEQTTKTNNATTNTSQSGSSNSTGTQTGQTYGANTGEQYGATTGQQYGANTGEQYGANTGQQYGTQSGLQSNFGTTQSLAAPWLTQGLNAVNSLGQFSSGVPINGFQWGSGNNLAQLGSGASLGTAFGTANDVAQGGIGDPSRYMSPYLSQVADAAMSKSNDAYLRANQQTGSRQASQGSLGNTTNARERAFNQSNKMDADNAMLSNLYNQGFQQSGQLSAQDAQTRLAGATAANALTGTLGNINTGLGAQGQNIFNSGTTNAMLPYQQAQSYAGSLGTLAGQLGQQTSNLGQNYGQTAGLTSGQTYGQQQGQTYGQQQGQTYGLQQGQTYGQQQGQTTNQSDFTGQSTGTQQGTSTQTQTPSTAGVIGQVGKALPGIMAAAPALMAMLRDGGAVPNYSNGGGIVDPHSPMTQKVEQAFEAFSNMRARARGGRIGDDRPGYAFGGWDTTMTMGDTSMSPDAIMSTAQGNEAWNKTSDMAQGIGDAFAPNKQKSPGSDMQGGGQGDEFGFGAIAAQQQGLSQMMRPMGGMPMARGGVPGYEDGGVRWGDEGPVFPARDYETPRMDVAAPSASPSPLSAREDPTGEWPSAPGPQVMGSQPYRAPEPYSPPEPEPQSWWQRGLGGLNPANWGMPTVRTPDFIRTSAYYDSKNAPNAYDRFFDSLVQSSPMLRNSSMQENEKNRLAQLQADRMQRQFEAQQEQARQLALGNIDGQQTIAAKTQAEQERANKAREEAEQWTHAVDPQTGEIVPYNRKTGERKGSGVASTEMNPLGLKKWRETALTKDLPEAKGRYDKGKEQGENFDTITKLLPYMISGKYADQELEIRRFASKFLGLGDTSKIATTELVRQLTQQGVLDQLKQMRPATDLDAKFAQQGTASIANDPNTLAIFAPGLAAMGKRSAFRANLEMRFIEAGQPPFLASNEAKIEKVIKQAEAEGVIPKSPWETYAQQLELGRTDGPATGPKAPGKVDRGRLDGSPAPSPKTQLLNLPDGVHDLPNGRFIKRGTILTPVSGDLGTQTNPFGKQTDIQHAGQFAYGPDGKLYRRTKNLFTDRWEEVTQ